MASVGLRPIEVFIAVAEGGSLSQAARMLGVSQPAVSESLGSIERAFGARLFRRGSAGFELTPAGRTLLGPAQQLVRSYGQLLGALDPHARLEAGELGLSCPAMLAQDPLAPLVGRFRSLRPKIRIRVYRPLGLSAAVDHLNSGKAEVALIAEQADDAPNLVFEPLVRQSYVGIVPPDARLPESGPLECLLGIGLVAPAHRSTARRMMEEILGLDRYAESITVETAHLGSMVMLVLNGVGAAVVSETLADEARALGVKTFTITPSLESEVFLLHRSDWQSPAAEEFLRVSRDMSRSGTIKVFRSEP